MKTESKFGQAPLTKLITAGAALCLLTGSNAFAADAVAIQNWDGPGPGGTDSLGLGGSISMTGFAGKQSAYTDNPQLNYSSWAHTGAWWNFQLTDTATTTIRVAAQAGQDFWPGFSVWASGDTVFDGGTTSFGGEVSSAGFGTPHSFNSTGAQGDSGTQWMANGFGGNILETLGYAVSNTVNYPGTTPTGWGEGIFSGAHDVSLTNIFENGITGSVGNDFAELVFNDLAAGWYTLYVGGTNDASLGGFYDINVSTVPIPAAAWLFGSALLGLVGVARRKSLSSKTLTA